MTPFEPYPTADQDIVIGLGSGQDWPNFCETIGLPKLSDDPRFAEDEVRLTHRDLLDEILGQHFKQKPSSHWLALLIENEIPCSAIENVESVASNPISAEYHAFSTVNAPGGGEMRFARNPIADPDDVESAAPTLGQHTSEILSEWLYRDEIAGMLGQA